MHVFVNVSTNFRNFPKIKIHRGHLNWGLFDRFWNQISFCQATSPNSQGTYSLGQNAEKQGRNGGRVLSSNQCWSSPINWYNIHHRLVFPFEGYQTTITMTLMTDRPTLACKANQPENPPFRLLLDLWCVIVIPSLAHCYETAKKFVWNAKHPFEVVKRLD